MVKTDAGDYRFHGGISQSQGSLTLGKNDDETFGHGGGSVIYLAVILTLQYMQSIAMRTIVPRTG